MKLFLLFMGRACALCIQWVVILCVFPRAERSLQGSDVDCLSPQPRFLGASSPIVAYRSQGVESQ